MPVFHHPKVAIIDPGNKGGGETLALVAGLIVLSVIGYAVCEVIDRFILWIFALVYGAVAVSLVVMVHTLRRQRGQTWQPGDQPVIGRRRAERPQVTAAPSMPQIVTVRAARPRRDVRVSVSINIRRAERRAVEQHYHLHVDGRQAADAIEAASAQPWRSLTAPPDRTEVTSRGKAPRAIRGRVVREDEQGV